MNSGSSLLASSSWRCRIAFDLQPPQTLSGLTLKIDHGSNAFSYGVPHSWQDMKRSK